MKFHDYKRERKERGSCEFFTIPNALLRPAHDWCMFLLKRIPMDGASIKKGLYGGKRTLFSFDLSSATDRLILTFQKLLIEKLFKKECVEAWVDGIAIKVGT